MTCAAIAKCLAYVECSGSEALECLPGSNLRTQMAGPFLDTFFHVQCLET